MSEPWVPKIYQFESIQFLLKNCNGGLLLDPGMGKTAVMLAVISFLLQGKHINRVLVVAPIRPMYMVWPEEIKKWDEFRHLSYTILHGDDKDGKVSELSDIYLINPEGLKWLMQSGAFTNLNVDMLIVDESTKFKDYSTARFKLMKTVLGRFKRRVILTGEPNPNGYMDLFGQCYVMDRGHALGQYITHYRAQYFYPSGYGGYDFKLRPGADKEIQDRIRPYVVRLSAEEHLDMPELIFNDIKVELPPEVMKIYAAFEDEFLAEVGDQVILSVNAAASGSKCRQVANGGVYDQNHLAHFIHDVKTMAAVDLVEQLQGTPVIIVYEFQHDLDRLKRVFPEAPILTGVTGTKLENLIHAFNRGEMPILLAHPMSAGHGLNLQEACHHVCFYGLTWDLDLYHQMYKRVWRQGQPSNRVFVHRILANRTLDQVVVKSLYAKDKTQRDFMEGVRHDRKTARN